MKTVPRTAIASDGQVGEFVDFKQVPGTKNIIVTYYCRNTKYYFYELIEDFYD